MRSVSPRLVGADGRRAPNLKALIGKRFSAARSGRRRCPDGQTIRRVFARIGEELEEFSSGGPLRLRPEGDRTHGPPKFLEPKRPRRDGTDALVQRLRLARGPMKGGPRAAPLKGACRQKRRVAPHPWNRQLVCAPAFALANVNVKECEFRVQSIRTPRRSSEPMACAAQLAQLESACAPPCPIIRFIHQPHPNRAPVALRWPNEAQSLRPAACPAGARRNLHHVQQQNAHRCDASGGDPGRRSA